MATVPRVEARGSIRRLVGVALVGMAAAALIGYAGGCRVAFSAACGAGAGSLVQIWAARRLLRAQVGMVEFLGDFARAAIVRVVGGTAIVLAAMVMRVPSTLAFLAGFGALYVVMEILTNLAFVQNEGRSESTG